MADRDSVFDREEYFDGDKVKVRVTPNPVTGEISTVDPEAIRSAGWSDDPGTGRTVLTEDGREVFNPVPMAPPIGYEPLPTLFELMDKMLSKRLAVLNGDDVIDESEEEANDFDVEDDTPDPLSIYEIVDMIPEHPALPKASSVSEGPPVAERSGEVASTPVDKP